MRTTFLERILQRHFGARAEPVAEAIVNSPQLKSMLAEMDAEQIAHRAELAENLRTAPARHEPVLLAASRDVERARQALLDAHEAVKVATEKYAAAQSRSLGLSAVYEREKGELTRELERSADARLEAFARDCMDVFDTVRQYRGKEIHHPPGRTPRVSFDTTARDDAIAALQSAACSARAMKLQAISYDEVSAGLAELRAGLVAVLGAAGFRDQLPGLERLPQASLH